MAGASYTAQVDKDVAAVKELMLLVRNESVERAIEAMQEPGPSRARVASAVAAGEGLGKARKGGGRGVSKRAFGPVANPGGAGNLPVDTGFLRASLRVSLGDALPQLVATPKERRAQAWDAAQVELTIAGADLDDTITAAYTAAYAARIEYGFAGTDSAGRTYSQGGRRFVGLAVQRWPQIVEGVVAELKARRAT